MKKCSIRLQSVSAELAEETTMINGCKVAALCVSEIQNENTQSMIYPTPAGATVVIVNLLAFLIFSAIAGIREHTA